MSERMDAVEKPVGAEAELGPVALELELCKACGICIELCPEEVFDRDELAYPVIARPDACNQCLICELHCPDFAIEVRRRERKAKAPAAVGAPAFSRDDLIAATSTSPRPEEACNHDGEV